MSLFGQTKRPRKTSCRGVSLDRARDGVFRRKWEKKMRSKEVGGSSFVVCRSGLGGENRIKWYCGIGYPVLGTCRYCEAHETRKGYLDICTYLWVTSIHSGGQAKAKLQSVLGTPVTVLTTGTTTTATATAACEVGWWDGGMLVLADVCQLMVRPKFDGNATG